MTREISVAGRAIGDGHPCFVVAEIGHNHQGDLDLAKRMIKAAAEAGVSAVKLQKRSLDALFTDDLASEPTAGEHAFGPTYLEHRRALELDEDAWREAAAFAASLQVTFFGTAFDRRSADFLASIGAPLIKVASGDAMNWPLLDHVADLGVPMVISTGGLDWPAVDATVGRLQDRNAEFAILQCTSAYPCPPADVELRVISEMRRRYPDVVIGYSGHEKGFVPTIGAVALGAAVVERHFTTDQNLKGSDHRYSLNPTDMSALTAAITELDSALGTGTKRRSASENSALRKLGKKLVAARELPAGHRLTNEDLDVRSPGEGTSPHLLESFVGKRLTRSLAYQENVDWSAVS
jgi:N-acetylneuraminate synthase/sialic acid synthase